jgi:4-oxalocrotonate tautomerase|tara:strand:+ start:54 stop:233 length:180 start_codon:yes stop_codon:yes gene_type:complete
MPYINIKLAGSLNQDQKEKISKGITDLMQQVANKPPLYTYIVFDEVKPEDWSIGGSFLG